MRSARAVVLIALSTACAVPGRAVDLKDARGRVWVADVQAGVMLADGSTVAATRGDARRIRGSERGLEVDLRIAPLRGRAARAVLTVTNRSSAPVRLDRLTVLQGRVPAGGRFGQVLWNDLHSWAGAYRLPTLRPGSRADSYWTVACQSPALAAGFLTGEHNIDRFRLEAEGAALRVTAWGDCDGCVLPAGQSRASDPVFLSGEPDPLHELERYADLAARENRARIWSPNFATWCSWYAGWIRQGMYSYKKGLEAGVEDNIPRVKQLFGARGAASMRIVDDSDAMPYGDYGDVTEAVPHGFSRLAGLMRQQGIRAGIWFPAFMVSDRTRLFRDHPAWLGQTADGKVQTEEFYGNRCGVLDATNPAAAAYFTELGARLHATGFRYFMTDFLLHSMHPARLYDPTKTKAEMNRLGLEALRTGFGPDAYWLGCGALLGPSMGLVDGMRIAGDSFGNEPHAYVQSGYRWFYHRRLWLNDPDAIVSRGKSVEWNRAWMSWMAVAGQVLTYGDTFDDLPEEQVAVYKRVFPPMDIAGRPLDLWENYPYLLWGATLGSGADRYDLLALSNFGPGGSATVRLNLDEAVSRTEPDRRREDAPTRYLLWDFWGQQLLTTDGPSLTVPLPDRGGRLFAVREDTGRPQLVGTSGHFSQGALEVRGPSWKTGTLAGWVRGNGGDPTTLFLYVPSGWSVASAKLGGEPVTLRTVAPTVMALDVPALADHTPFTVRFDGNAADLVRRARASGPVAVKSASPELAARRAAIAGSLPAGARLAAYVDCGDMDEDGAALRVAQGSSFTWAGASSAAPAHYGSVAFAKDDVILEAAGLDPNRDYELGFSWWDYDANGRIESVRAAAASGPWQPLLPATPLPAWATRRQPPEERRLTIPRALYRDGRLRIAFHNDGGTENAVVSEVWLIAR